MNSKKRDDLKMGGLSETKCKVLIEKHFKIALTKSTYKYAIFDFYTNDKKKYFELKTRRVNKDTYPDIIMGYNKIKRGFELIDEGCDVYLLWCFNDGLYYYKLDKDTFNYDWIKKAGRTDRDCYEINDCALIPTDLLQPIQ
jgi:hypothetical protein